MILDKVVKKKVSRRDRPQGFELTNIQKRRLDMFALSLVAQIGPSDGRELLTYLGRHKTEVYLIRAIKIRLARPENEVKIP